jgi:segregation and condensation protein B
MNNLVQKIEAILFFKGEPVSMKKLGEVLKVSKEELGEAIIELNNNLKERGIVLLEKGDEITLGTNPELSSLIEDLQKEELNKELSKASLEVLSIVLYKNGVTRAEIDYIRGVNSSFTLRMLSIRGLVEKTLDPKDNRRFIYKPTFDLLFYMGVKNVQELPEYESTNQNLNEAGARMEEEIKEAEEVEQ